MEIKIISMKQQFGSLILVFILLTFSACIAEDNVIPYNDYVAISSSAPANESHSSRRNDSVRTSPPAKKVIPAQYQHIFGMDYQKWLNPARQIGEYVRRIFEDKAGNLWFGTNGEGVARFNGKNLFYYSTFNGLSGSQVTAIMEDDNGNIWCGTQGGISRFEASQKKSAGQGSEITNFTTKEGLADNWVWSLYQDSKGTIWAGTSNGLCRFNGSRFTPFPLPGTMVEHPEPSLSLERVSSIAEDKSGNLWFGTDGGGVYSFDGKNYTNYTKADGLCDNSITSIVQDRKGNIWFGTMNGGLSLFDGTSFSSFTEKNGMIGNNEVWNIYEDKKGNIWFSSEGFGVYRYNGKKLVNFGEKEGLGIKAVQTIYEDSKGRLWIGGGGGLYRFDGRDTFFNVTRDGLTDGC
jgi:ligand-binding sensor domain-containing protein